MRRLVELAAVIVAAALAIGCGNDKGGGAGDVAGGKAVARGEPDVGGSAVPAAGIVGTWVYDRMTLVTPPTDEKGKALEQAMKMMPKMNVEYVFAADGTFTMTEQVGEMKPSALKGTWVEEDGKYVVTETEKDGKPRVKTGRNNTVHMELKDGDLSLNPPNAPMVFHLKRK